MVGALLEHSCSFILIANNSSSFQIIPFHSKSLLFINMFLDYFKQLLQYIYRQLLNDFLDVFFLLEWFGLFVVSYVLLFISLFDLFGTCLLCCCVSFIFLVVCFFRF